MKDYNEHLKLKGVARIKAFGLLNKEEKYGLWEFKLKKILKEEDLNNQQVALINEVMNFLSPEFYNLENYEKNKSDLKLFQKSWLPKVEKHFTDEQIRSFFYGK